MEEIADGLLRPTVPVGDKRTRKAELQRRNGAKGNDSFLVFPVGSSDPSIGRMFCDTLWMEFIFGELGLWDSGRGNSGVDGSNHQREDDDKHVGRLAFGWR